MTYEQSLAAHRRALSLVGQQIFIRRVTGTANQVNFDAQVWARVTRFEPAELLDGIKQGDRKLIVLNEDLEIAQFPLPVRKNDKAIVGGKVLNIEFPDDQTRRIGPRLVAWELAARG